MGSSWNDYSGLEWLDSGQQPTETEINSKISELDACRTNEIIAY